MNLVKIDVDEILLIHDTIIDTTGGSKGVREAGLLESICKTPFGNYFGQELYPDLFLKAAVIMNSLINFHVFLDGNKRAAIAVTEYFLFKNGYEFTKSKVEKEKFVLFAATTNPDLADISQWIKKNARKKGGK